MFVLTLAVCATYLPAIGLRLFGPPRVTMDEAFAKSSGKTQVDHSALDRLLRAHVDADGWVDYRGLKKEAVELGRYVDFLSGVAIADLGRDERLALLINAYNAFTLQLILEHYPLDSIKDIPARDRWDAVRWKLGGHTWSLNQIEHEQIRAKFAEPRIHFALVCAAVGCPPLRNEAYRADRLEDQLAGQTDYVHSHPRWFQVDSNVTVVRLTKLYEWYGDDFVQKHGSVMNAIAAYLPKTHEGTAPTKKPRIRWLPYDWSLNDVTNRPSPPGSSKRD
ncbi:MAG: DUF547 domain-containing protein [Planctomycetes bacterium]|nr:DUF547 domain-containing protein [Planctomycetota bacterium]